MNILIVSSYLPYPLNSGGHVRLYNLIKHISKKHKIILVCEKRPYQTGDDGRMLEKYCQKVICVPRKQQWSLPNIIKTGISGNPFLVTGHTLPGMRKAIEEVLESYNIDLIHAETFYIMQNIPDNSIPLVLAEHNIEYQVYKKYAAGTPLLIRQLLDIDINKIRHKEEEAWNRASTILTVSENDKETISKDNVFVVANGVDTSYFTFQRQQYDRKEYSILFIGDYKWMQNVDAANWLVTDIWPAIVKKLDKSINIRLYLVGKNMPDELVAKIKHNNIIPSGELKKDAPDIFHDSQILLAPTRVKGGTSYKIIEAMASGVPVVTTSLGISGIKAIPYEHVLVADTVDDIVNKTLSLITDHKLYDKLALNARKMIEKHYDWSVIALELDKAYHAAISGKLR